MSDKSRIRSAWNSVLHEPTFHFLLLAGLLFTANAVTSSHRPNVVQVDRGELAARILQLEARTGVPLSTEERLQLEDAFIDEQILVLEARQLGLDRDTRIHDLLAQKMLHVLSADVIQPDQAELQAFYDANLGSYTPGPTVTLDEMVLGTVDSLSPGVQARLREGAPPERFMGDLPAIHKVLGDVTRDDLAGIMDLALADSVFGADIGLWVGPLVTVRGQHWYRVTSRGQAAPQPLAEIKGRVRLDWIAQEEAARLQGRVAELRSRYAVVWTGGEAPP